MNEKMSLKKQNTLNGLASPVSSLESEVVVNQALWISAENFVSDLWALPQGKRKWELF